MNDLICIRQEDDEVFDITHQLIADYYKKGYFQGVRVDHIDGLLKPTEYLHNLRELFGNNAYILVEKILGKDEKLPSNWPVQGTTGYDYLGAVNELLIKKANTEVFTNIYHTYIGGDINYLTMVERKKRFMLRKRMAGELENLLYLLQGSSANTDEAFNYREAVTYLLSLFPIYRTYIENDGHKGWHAIYEDTAGKIAGFENEISELKKVFSLQSPKDIQFVLRFQQLSGPLAAKGVEDTAFYQYNRFIGQNEVGDEPLSFGETTEKFHQYILERKESWPLAMNNSSTHDTKRGEDARARLAAVSGDTQSWSNFVDHITEQTGSAGPTPNDRYMILQSIVGAWPANGNLEENFNQRFQEFLQKALREGKNQTSWASPNLQYENVCFSYYKSLLEKKKTKQIISEYVSKLIRPGFLNSINTLILKFTLPGIPDIYQGCESWNFSFVDPDNRRPVDYEKFNRVLDEIHSVNEKETTADFIEKLWKTPADETLKIALTQKLVQLRRAEAELLTNGEYIPVETNTDAIAYFRTNEYQWLFVFLSFGEEVAFNADKIKFPGGAPEKWTDIFTQESGGMNEIKQNFPFICLKGDL